MQTKKSVSVNMCECLPVSMTAKIMEIAIAEGNTFQEQVVKIVEQALK